LRRDLADPGVEISSAGALRAGFPPKALLQQGVAHSTGPVHLSNRPQNKLLLFEHPAIAVVRKRLLAADDPPQLLPAGLDLALVAVFGRLVVVHPEKLVGQVLLFHDAKLGIV
jgi:hypothetical protein